MALYNKEDYFQIYDPLIEVGKKYPFDSYLLLPKNKRIVLLVNKDVEFTKEQLHKFSKLKKSGIFIKQEDIKIYFDFFKKNIKKDEYNWLVEKIKNSSDENSLQGIPTEIIENLRNPNNKEISEKVISVTNKNDIAEKKQNILTSIEKIINEMEIVRDINSFKEKDIIIKNITEKIKPEIKTITNLINSLPYDEHPELIAGSAMLQDKYIGLISWVNDLKDYIINVLPEKNINNPEQSIIINKIINEDFLSEALDLKRIVTSSEPEVKDIEAHHLEAQTIIAEDIVAGSINAKSIIADKITIDGVEQTKSNLTRNNEEPPPNNNLDKTSLKQNDNLLKIFKNFLYKLEGYDNNKTTVQGNLAGIKEKISAMINENFIKKNNSCEKYNLTQLLKNINEFENDAFGPNTIYNSLILTANKICEALNITNIKITPKKVIPGVYRINNSIKDYEEISFEKINKDITFDELKKSYCTLEAQVRNLDSVIASNNTQISENEKIIKSSQEYIMQLENENFFYMKRNEESQNSSNASELKIEKLMETQEDSIKLMAKTKADLNSKTKQIKLLESTIEAFNAGSTATSSGSKEESSLEDLYKKKSRSNEDSYRDIINKQNQELSGYINKIANLEKRLIEYTHKLSRAESFNRGLGAKLEKIDKEKFELEKLQKNLDLRNKIVSTMLEQTRKSFEKLNSINLKLKNDKALFYKKMAEKLEENKSLKQEIHKQSIKTDSEKSQIEKLEKIIENHKEKERENIAKFSELKDSHKLIYEENKSLKRDIINLKNKIENLLIEKHSLKTIVSQK